MHFQGNLKEIWRNVCFRDKTPAAEFPAHFSRLSADENRGFSQEYEVREPSARFDCFRPVVSVPYLRPLQDLGPVGGDLSQSAADLFENREKNRFTNVLPCKLVTAGLSQLRGPRSLFDPPPQMTGAE